VDSFIAIGADGSVTAYNGHVDLGTGVRTALGQLVADELYVDFAAVTMVLGHTARTPDLGPTIASNTIQVSSLPMRHAAAQVRQLLIKLASEKSGVPADRITTQKGFVIAGGKRYGYGELVQGQDLQIEVDDKIELRKSGFEYIGKSVQRVDIPNKVLGALTYIHDLRVPGMLHGRVIRPPYTGADATAPWAPAWCRWTRSPSPICPASSRSWSRATSWAWWPSVKSRPSLPCASSRSPGRNGAACPICR
jgi:CO/xanthine dehydrogenase Mo-binding subunit